MTGIIHRMLAHKRLSEQEAQSRADFLASAKGDTGPAGEQGPKGDTGRPPKHQWKGTTLRFLSRSTELGENSSTYAVRLVTMAA